MAVFKLSSFAPIPEGATKFTIESIEYKADFGKMEVKCVTESGRKHSERFTLVNGQGEPINGAMIAFSMLARAAMDDRGLDEIEHTKLVGKSFMADVQHEEVPKKDDPSKMTTFIRLKNYRPADKPSYDLKNLLGGK